VQPDLHFRGLPEWALWIPEADLPRRASLPPNVFFVGPSVDVTRTDGSAPSPWRADGTFRIYAAVGTVRARWRENVGFLRKTIEALGGIEEFQVLLSTGDERTTAALGAAPRNITIRDFVPQLDVLRGADLVITHGGAGTYRECIHYQVPMLVYPRNHDQLGNSARIVHHGLGLRGDRARDSAADIRGKAHFILTCATFRHNLQCLNAATRAAEAPLLAHALDQLLGDAAADFVAAPSEAGAAG
jgi:MGT family glycosyltransferase